MGQRDYYTEFHEALGKAFAARDPKVRDAWLDLADFCRSKLPGLNQPGPKPNILRELALVPTLPGARSAKGMPRQPTAPGSAN